MGVCIWQRNGGLLYQFQPASAMDNWHKGSPPAPAPRPTKRDFVVEPTTTTPAMNALQAAENRTKQTHSVFVYWYRKSLDDLGPHTSSTLAKCWKSKIGTNLSEAGRAGIQFVSFFLQQNPGDPCFSGSPLTVYQMNVHMREESTGSSKLRKDGAWIYM